MGKPNNSMIYNQLRKRERILTNKRCMLWKVVAMFQDGTEQFVGENIYEKVYYYN